MGSLFNSSTRSGKCIFAILLHQSKNINTKEKEKKEERNEACMCLCVCVCREEKQFRIPPSSHPSYLQQNLEPLCVEWCALNTGASDGEAARHGVRAHTEWAREGGGTHGHHTPAGGDDGVMMIV